ncbi:hypothetical protein [Streptacidiphilus sp. P02-A3a]|uniref:hypothetical protein n=1 Tax=Streptacidiphilus sp. P02-A3a TaxID=2704468 RepID=UPI0015F8C229|nr:hypothetical protein [Streptacidiphilus sp. P02-A3a]QMU69164.1 hypothetical protein GXP74_13800 [Streptacidiphilus sp. P02-A3a]
MTLRFIGIDPETNGNGSSTFWIDEDSREIIAQGYIAGEALRQKVAQTPAPGHEAGIPEGEDIIRIPVRLVPVLRKVCDAAERMGLG